MQNNVLDYLDEIIEKNPDKVAFADDTEEFSFRQTYEVCRAIGSGILSRGIRRRPVVVFMRKHPREIVTFFGVIKAGCFYVPIDEEMPEARIRLILENVQAPLLICDDETYEKAQAFDFGGEIVRYSEISASEVREDLLKDAYDKALDTDPIYIVFTSGSTGVPKGVAACHRSVLDYVEQLSETLGFNEETVFGNQTPLYFDACLKELYPTLKFGATTYLIPRSLFMMPIKLVEYMNEKKINTICWVVSALTMISAFGTFDKVKPEYLTNIAFGSEVFPIKQFKIWRETLPEASFTNLYGPTEGTGMCCFFHVDRDFEDTDVIPIGHPFKNTEILLLKDRKEAAAPGEEGEMCIRGTSVTLGYYNNPEKTGEVYIQNPLNTAYPEIIYCTGDIGKYNDRGELIFVSRKDYQIKHMGHRIELGEIEINASTVPGVKFAACIYDQAAGKIVIFYVGDPDEKEFVTALRGKLPRYMLPNVTCKLSEMPLTANGKIDKVTLKKMYEESK
ncbi:MAG: amino acid adenylation domain-containing protein [Lachnospiraceae bacterium]|nr:amino acid adenylation domain-containing protein [Lachnospiraceae bacterium]